MRLHATCICNGARFFLGIHTGFLQFIYSDDEAHVLHCRRGDGGAAGRGGAT